MGPIKIVQLGARMPMSTRRVVRYFDKSTAVETTIGTVMGMADGAVVFVTRFGKSYELTPTLALDIGEAFKRAAYGVERWQEHASGFNRIRVKRSEDGEVVVTHRGQTRVMRLSKLRGRVRRDGKVDFYRSCGNCRDAPTSLWVAAGPPSENGRRVHYVQLCPACVDKLANLPEEIAEVQPIREAAEGEGT